jgi:hypothetical protein
VYSGETVLTACQPANQEAATISTEFVDSFAALSLRSRLFEPALESAQGTARTKLGRKERDKEKIDRIAESSIGTGGEGVKGRSGRVWKNKQQAHSYMHWLQQ